MKFETVFDVHHVPTCPGEDEFPEIAYIPDRGLNRPYVKTVLSRAECLKAETEAADFFTIFANASGVAREQLLNKKSASFGDVTVFSSDPAENVLNAQKIFNRALASFSPEELAVIKDDSDFITKFKNKLKPEPAPDPVPAPAPEGGAK